MNIQCSGGSRSFAEETRALTMRTVTRGDEGLDDEDSDQRRRGPWRWAQWPAIGSWQQPRESPKLILLQRHAAAAAKLLQSCPTLCDPIDGSPSGSSVPGILQARTLEWVGISFSNAWKWKVKVKSLSHIWVLATPWTAAHQAPPSMGFSRQEYWSWVPLPSPTLHEKLPANPVLTILQLSSIWSKLEMWKSSVRQCLMSWPQIKKSLSVVFSWSVQQQRTISSSECDVWPDVDCIRQPVTASSVVGPRRSSKAKLAPEKVMVTVWWSTANLIHYSFLWILQNHHIWEVCSTNWWDAPKTAMPAAGIGQQRGPRSSPQQRSTTRRTASTSEIEQIGLRSFVSSAIFTWLLANQLPLFQASWQLFAGKTLPTTSRRQKMLFKCSSHPRAQIFMLQE